MTRILFPALSGLILLVSATSLRAEGAVQHAMPQGGYIGTVVPVSPAPRGAVQHAMPQGGYSGTGCPAGGHPPCPAPVLD